MCIAYAFEMAFEHFGYFRNFLNHGFLYTLEPQLDVGANLQYMKEMHVRVQVRLFSLQETWTLTGYKVCPIRPDGQLR